MFWPPDLGVPRENEAAEAIFPVCFLKARGDPTNDPSNGARLPLWATGEEEPAWADIISGDIVRPAIAGELGADTRGDAATVLALLVPPP